MPLTKVCRYYLNNNCKKGVKCKLLHPDPNSLLFKAEQRRPPKTCYCGADFKIIMRTRRNLDTEELDYDVEFYNICSSTGKSSRICYQHLLEIIANNE